MQKDFDTWNKKKKQLEVSAQNKFCRPGDIWWCTLGLNIGREHNGKQFFQRPVLVFKRFGDVALVIPVSTSQEEHIFRLPLGVVRGRKAVAVISQLRVVDTKRFSNKISRLDKNLFERIRKSVKDML